MNQVFHQIRNYNKNQISLSTRLDKTILYSNIKQSFNLYQKSYNSYNMSSKVRKQKRNYNNISKHESENNKIDVLSNKTLSNNIDLNILRISSNLSSNNAEDSLTLRILHIINLPFKDVSNDSKTIKICYQQCTVDLNDEEKILFKQTIERCYDKNFFYVKDKIHKFNVALFFFSYASIAILFILFLFIVIYFAKKIKTTSQFVDILNNNLYSKYAVILDYDKIKKIDRTKDANYIEMKSFSSIREVKNQNNGEANNTNIFQEDLINFKIYLYDKKNDKLLGSLVVKNDKEKSDLIINSLIENKVPYKTVSNHYNKSKHDKLVLTAALLCSFPCICIYLYFRNIFVPICKNRKLIKTIRNYITLINSNRGIDRII